MGRCRCNYRCCFDNVLRLKLNRTKRVELLIIFATLLFYTLNKFTPIFRFLPFDIAANHLNDFFAGILFPAYTNLILSFSKYRKLLRFDTIPRISLLILVCSFVWEFVAPIFLPFSTGDLLDIACYLLGGLFYWVIQRAAKSQYQNLFS